VNKQKEEFKKKILGFFVVGFAGCPVVHSWVVVIGWLVECATED